MSTLSRFAHELGTSERTLRRAVAEGLIRAARPGPRRLHMTPGEAAYLYRHWPLLARLRDLLRTEHNVRTAILFGSLARGGEHAGSDVDLLVDFRSADVLRAAELAVRLEERLGRTVQVVRLVDAERSPPLLAEVLREGRVLVDREGGWRRLRERAPEIAAAAAEEWRDLERALAEEYGYTLAV